MKGKALFYIAAVLLAWASASYAGTTELVSISSEGELANWDIYDSAISADGRYVAFSSYASNLVPGDTNKKFDVFVHDRATGETERVSVSSSGKQGNDTSLAPSISADGRYVAFESYANNLVAGDTNQWPDVFVHDRATGSTKRISVSSNGIEGNNYSLSPSISADGRYVTFESYARNLVSEDTNRKCDVFVHDRKTGVTERVSLDSDGTQGNSHSRASSISADGRFVVFQSAARNLVPEDTNKTWDIFVRDRVEGITERVSVDSNGNQSSIRWEEYVDEWPPGSRPFPLSNHPFISADARYVTFASYADNLVSEDTNKAGDIFIHDRVTGVTERVSVDSNGNQANQWSYRATMSADGRYVTFISDASNLVPEDTNRGWDVFVHDRKTGATERVSVDIDGKQVEHLILEYFFPTVSADGRYVTFLSDASNLVPGDTNGSTDAFVRDRGPNCTKVPEFEIASFVPRVIWPPNRKDVQLTVTGRVIIPQGCSFTGASYAFYDEYSGTVEDELEVDEENGYSFTFTADVEAWRDGDDKDGRVYSVSFTAEDEAGVGESGWRDSIVPHDRRKK